ncbi:MAG: ABC transporter permease [Dehalococcoidia bacterium]
MTLDKLYSFLWRDWQQARSYRLAFLMQSVGLAFPLIGIFFMARLFNNVNVDAIEEYGGSYVEFLIVGLMVVSYSGTALRSFTGSLRAAQVTGSLEILLLTPTKLSTMLFGWALYPLIRSTLFLCVYVLGGFIVVGLSFSNANVGAAVLTLGLTVMVMGSLGLFAASFTLAFKQGDPFTAILVLAAGMFSGTLYPVNVLPGWLQAVAQALPQTHAIEAMRLSLLRGYPISDLASDLIPLAIYAIVLLPIGILSLRLAMHQARVDGSLGHY